MYPSCGVRSVIKRGRLWRGMGKPKPLSSVLSTSHLPDTWFTVFTPTPSRLNNVTLTDAMGAELKMGSHDKTFPFPSQRAIYSTCSVRGLIYSEDNERTFSMRWDEKRICVMTASVTADWGDLKKKKEGCRPVWLVSTVTAHAVSIPPSSEMKCTQCTPTTCKTWHAVEGSKAALIPSRSHIPPLSPLVYLSLKKHLKFTNPTCPLQTPLTAPNASSSFLFFGFCSTQGLGNNSGITRSICLEWWLIFLLYLLLKLRTKTFTKERANLGELGGFFFFFWIYINVERKQKNSN